MKVLVVLVLAVFTGEYEEIKISLLFLERDKLSPGKIRIKKCKLRVRYAQGCISLWLKNAKTCLNCSFVHPTGCHANLFYADAPKPQLEVLTDAFWDYIGKATQTADDTLDLIRKSQFGQEVK